MFLLNDKSTSKLIKHNLSLFKKSNKIKKKTFLLEFNGWQSIQIANSYLVNTIPFIKNSKIVAFDSHRLVLNKKYSIIDNIKWYIGSLLKIKNFGIYSSFCVDDFMLTKNDKTQKNLAKEKTIEFFKNYKRKEDIENYVINNVWIGDLIYDTFMKKYNVPTIEINMKGFREFFEECILNFLFWEDYIKRTDISGIAVCHALYTFAIPLRIAIKKKIPAYAVSDFKLFKIDNTTLSFDRKTNGVEFQHNYYKKIFNKFSSKEQKKYLLQGKNFLKNFLSGKQVYYYMQNRKKKSNKQFLKKNNKKKIVIYAHSFFDSPHYRGNFLFPDFYEWLIFLAKIAKKTNLEWYLKPHPNYEDDNINEINNFVKKYTVIKILDVKATNKDLIKQGMKYALTIYGSCAAELPYYGIKVINADPKNPHSNYKFSLNPKNRKELERMILNIQNEKIRIRKNELYEYHFMNQIYFHNNYLFPYKDQNKLHQKKKGREIIYSQDIIDYWTKNFSIKNHEKIQKTIMKFHTSGDLYLNLKHSNQ